MTSDCAVHTTRQFNQNRNFTRFVNAELITNCREGVHPLKVIGKVACLSLSIEEVSAFLPVLRVRGHLRATVDLSGQQRHQYHLNGTADLP